MTVAPPQICFLDRDGTLIPKAADGEYVVDADDVELLPGVGGAVRALNRAGALVHVVTNQRGVALGRMTLQAVDRVNAGIARLLSVHGARVDAWWVCPHAESSCDCRKPRPGLILAGLAAVPGARPGRCVVIGDAETDVVAARAAHVPGVLLATAPPPATVARWVCRDLAEAVAKVLGQA